MNTQGSRPYGTWQSPITSTTLTRGSRMLGQVQVPTLWSADTLAPVFWVETRSDEGGRSVLCRAVPAAPSAPSLLDSDGKSDVEVGECAKGFSVRSRVHEYGGGEFVVLDDRAVVFCNEEDQALCFQTSDNNWGDVPLILMSSEKKMRFTDMCVSEFRRSEDDLLVESFSLFAVCEDHSSDKEAENLIVVVTFQRGHQPDLTRVVYGHDFYSSPDVSADGKLLCFLAWDHPNMPWDETKLYVARIKGTRQLDEPVLVFVGKEESILEPRWVPDASNRLVFFSDRNGFWNPFVASFDPDNLEKFPNLHHVIDLRSDFAPPPWLFGNQSYDFVGDNKIICAWRCGIGHTVAIVSFIDGKVTTVPCPFAEVEHLSYRHGLLIALCGSPSTPRSIVCIDTMTGAYSIVRKAFETDIDEQYFSVPELICFRDTRNSHDCFAYFYKPTNPDFTPESLDDRPPLIVRCHGGPTSNTSVSLNLKIQFWTSRGYGVCDVDYGGSTGYGRVYRQLLKGNWGIVDVGDCAGAAVYLKELGIVHPDRLAILGSSAGGYTALATLTFCNVFKAGCSLFGVSHLKSLAAQTHKFESRYLDGLVGPLPEFADVYEQRSPINACDRIQCPIILFQGMRDKIVTPDQSQRMFRALRQRGVPVSFISFEEEGHGFRQATSIQRTIDCQLAFFSRIFSLTLPHAQEPLHIHNIDV